MTEPSAAAPAPAGRAPQEGTARALQGLQARLGVHRAGARPGPPRVVGADGRGPQARRQARRRSRRRGDRRPRARRRTHAAAEAFCYGADLAYIVADADAHRLPQRALHQGADRSRQHLQAGDPAARRHHARPRSRRLGGHHAAHRPDRRLHRTRRRCRRLARRHAPDLRRLAAVHDLYAELPAADGDRAPARDADAGARRDARPAASSSIRSA